MKRFANGLAAGLYVCLCCSGSTGLAQVIQVSAANRTIEVTTTETAQRRADTALVHIGYQVYAASSDGAYGKAAAISEAVKQALGELGVPADAVESVSQSTGPVPEYGNNGVPALEAAQRKFQAQQSWIVHAVPETVAKILAAAVGAGANQSGDVDWSVKDEASLRAEAAGMALKDARSVAERMAGGLGAKLGPLVYASNSEPEQLRPMFNRMAAPVVFAGPPKKTPQLSLSPPLESSSATVRAVFAIE